MQVSREGSKERWGGREKEVGEAAYLYVLEWSLQIQEQSLNVSCKGAMVENDVGWLLETKNCVTVIG